MEHHDKPISVRLKPERPLLHGIAFEAASGEGQCISQAISNAVSYGDAMALAKIAPASAKLSAAQVRAAMDKKYGNSEGDAIYNEIIAVGADNAC